VLNGLQNLDLVLLAEKSLHFFQCGSSFIMRGWNFEFLVCYSFAWCKVSRYLVELDRFSLCVCFV
jgi:hypothetical protein